MGKHTVSNHSLGGCMLQFQIITDDTGLSSSDTQSLLQYLREVGIHHELHLAHQEALAEVYRLRIEREYGQKLSIRPSDYPFVLLIRDSGKIVWYQAKPELEEVQKVTERFRVRESERPRIV